MPARSKHDRLKIRRGSGNVFRDLGFPEGEAHTLALRSELMICIESVVRRSGLTRAAAAKRLAISRPKLNALLHGSLSRFDLDALVTIATRAGLRVEIAIGRGHNCWAAFVSRHSR